jgi:hypothetical protein
MDQPIYQPSGVARINDDIEGISLQSETPAVPCHSRDSLSAVSSISNVDRLCATETVKMLPRHTNETTVSMVPTPRSYATAPHVPAYRAQPSSQTLLRLSRPLMQQVSKMAHSDDVMLKEQKKLLLSRTSAETTLKVFDANAPVNSARKTYKATLAQSVPSKIKPASTIYHGSNSKSRVTTKLGQPPNHTRSNWDFKFVTKLNPRDSPPRELLEEQTALLLQQADSGVTSLKVFTDAPVDQVPHLGRASYRQAVMTPALGGRTRPVNKDASTQTTFAASSKAENAAPHDGAFSRDLPTPLADLQKQNVSLKKELEKANGHQTPKSDDKTAQNTVSGKSSRSDSHATLSVPNDMQVKEDAVIVEIRKTLPKRKRQHDSSVNITCSYSSFIPPVRMAPLIAETSGKLNMTIVTNVDTVTVFLKHDTTSRTTKSIVSLSGRVNVKVMNRPAERTKMSTSTPARPLLEPIEQRETTYNKVRKRIFAQRSSDPDKVSGAGLMTNPWGILVETPEQTGMDFQSVANAVLSRSDTTNEDDVCRPIITKTGLTSISKDHSNKLRRKRRFTQRQLYHLWLQEIQHVMVWMPESHAENVTDKTTAIGNIKNLEETVVSSNNRKRTIDDTPMCGSHSPEMSDDNLGELPEISCTQSRAFTSARSGRSLKSEQKRTASDQAGGRQCQTRQHAENALALAERTQHSHTADVLETMSLCTTVVTTFSTDKIALIHMLYAVNAACCLWRSMMLLTWYYRKQGNADGNNAQSLSSQRDNTEATSATDVWTTSLTLRTNWIGVTGGNEVPLPQRPQQRGRGGSMDGTRMHRPPTNQMDMDQVSITSGQSATTEADPDEIQAQMVLLALESLANSSSLKSIEDDDAHSIAHSDVSVLSHVNTSPGKSGFMSVLREHD